VVKSALFLLHEYIHLFSSYLFSFSVIYVLIKQVSHYALSLHDVLTTRMTITIYRVHYLIPEKLMSHHQVNKDESVWKY